MYERMLNKNTIPEINEINDYIGKKSVEYIELIIESLRNVLDIKLELKFPFGNNYGWGYKVSNKTRHLFYIFFKKNSIVITLQISKIKSEKELKIYNELSEEGKKYWENRYPCGDNGGWLHYRILNKRQLKDIGLFLKIKTNKEIKF